MTEKLYLWVNTQWMSVIVEQIQQIQHLGNKRVRYKFFEITHNERLCMDFKCFWDKMSLACISLCRDFWRPPQIRCGKCTLVVMQGKERFFYKRCFSCEKEESHLDSYFRLQAPEQFPVDCKPKCATWRNKPFENIIVERLHKFMESEQKDEKCNHKRKLFILFCAVSSF